MEGNRPLIAAVLFGSVPVVALLFRLLGPRRATLIAIIGGYVFLPSVMLDAPRPATIQLGKLVAIGAGLLLGIVCCDSSVLRRARPHPLDWAMIAYAAYPLTGLATGGRMLPWDVADMIIQRGLGWLAPYVAARLYFSDEDGARRVGVAIMLGALLLVPACAFETVMGPRWYLEGLIFGIPYQAGMVERLGGWRPEGFFQNGIHLATWMALGAVTATLLWIGGAWRPRRGPAWWPALVLALTTAACRGIYGYLTLGLGLAAALLTRGLRTRWVLVAMVGLAPLYIGLRASGIWDARTLTGLAGVVGRPGTVGFRLGAEDGIMASVLSKHPALGYGIHIWHNGAVRETFLWPDGWWLVVLWEGGFVGLAVHLAALHLWPAGLALARPKGRPGPRDATPPAWGLALFTILHMIESLHNQSPILPTALIAGALVGRATGRAPARPGGPGPRISRAAFRPVGLPTDPSTIPALAGLACLLYVFGHGPVPDHEAAKLIGGLGAALLFAAAGGVGAWASERVPLARLAGFGLLFAALGVSFNLALHPRTRPAATADLPQGLALAGLVVACWRRGFGPGAGGDAALAALPLAAHFLLGPRVPAGLPGLQYFIAGPGEARSLFPLCPWLTLAAFGAWATRVGPAVNLAASALFAASAAWACWAASGSGGPVKFPINLSYALLSCAAVGLASALARALNARGPAARGLHWLGRRWLIFFYLHFAVAFALTRTAALPAWAVWGVLASASVAATWLVSKALAPLGRWFQAPVAWGVLLASIFATALAPGLPPEAVAALAGLAGLTFAAHYESLAYCIMHARGAMLSPAPIPSVPISPGRGTPNASNDLGRNAARLALVLILLATPELLDAVIRRGKGDPPGERGRPTSPPSARARGPRVPAIDPEPRPLRQPAR